MKRTRLFGRFAAVGLALLGVWSVRQARGATSIDPVNRYAYAANLGWADWHVDATAGAVIGEYVCSGYVYAANVGWISLGSGSPANGIRYQNDAAGDYGVNCDGLGNLRGFAWGANIGWVNFEVNGSPRLDLATGKFGGYAWSANCGWISLSNAAALVQTDFIAPGADTDGDGIADAWERTWFGNLARADGSSDYDHDGMTDRQEYLADTNPLDANDNLRITDVERGQPPHSSSYVVLKWTARPTRFYSVERRPALDIAAPWEPYLSYGWLGWDNVGFDDTGSQAFYRVRATRPLMP